MANKQAERPVVLVDDLGGGFPTFPAFVALLRAYEAETDRRASIAAMVGDVTRWLTSSWAPMGQQPTGSVNTLIGYHAGAFLPMGSHNTVVGEWPDASK